jgi:pilus assembly protein CpaF
VTPTVASCIDIVIHCEMDKRGTRRIVEILAPSGQVSGTAGHGGVIEASTIFALEGRDLIATGGYPTKLAKFRSAGLDPSVVLARGSR